MSIHILKGILSRNRYTSLRYFQDKNILKLSEETKYAKLSPMNIMNSKFDFLNVKQFFTKSYHVTVQMFDIQKFLTHKSRRRDFQLLILFVCPRLQGILRQVFLQCAIIAALDFTGSVDGTACDLGTNAF